ncbi:hypothetical protein EYF80_050673 [Liparis tanakae]|uniref:Uncharacterized protein n=1 Tax=Liparis tanakae TaxID=230148 RepID=A0A4Z2FD96_9TELE|nr:hypothetical protein EYF80_050673 [Liparis tanakae]
MTWSCLPPSGGQSRSCGVRGAPSGAGYLCSASTSLKMLRKMLTWCSLNTSDGRNRMDRSPQPPSRTPEDDTQGEGGPASSSPGPAPSCDAGACCIITDVDGAESPHTASSTQEAGVPSLKVKFRGMKAVHQSFARAGHLRQKVLFADDFEDLSQEDVLGRVAHPRVEDTRSVGNGAIGQSNEGTSSLWIALECVVAKQPSQGESIGLAMGLR